MNRLICKSLIVLLLVSTGWASGWDPAAAAAPAASGLTDPAELEAFVDGVIADQMNTNHIPGAVVSVVKDGALFFAKGYGFADLENRVPVNPETTLFRPGSVSKLFVWTAVMQLVEQGMLSLDADVNTYLDFTIPATYPQPITLKNLLTHTPGFEDQGADLFKLKTEQLTSLDAYLKTHIPARVFPPGKLGAYSNYGAALAGYIVERVSGVPFAAYVEQNIFAPLGMTHSTFRQPLPAELGPDMSGGYNFVNGEYLRGAFELVQAYPAGSLSSTAADIAKFMIAHLQNGRYGEARILAENTAQEMHQQLFTHDPRIEGMAYGFFESSLNGQRIISHGGDTILFHTGLFLLLDQNVGVFVSTNSAGGAGTGAALIKLFMNHYYPVETQPAPVPPADFASRAAPYVGEYYTARSNFTTFEKFLMLLNMARISVDQNGYLLISMMGQTIQGVEIEPGLIRDRYDPNLRVVLHTDEAGQAAILPAEPFAYIKAPWYGTASFQVLLVGSSLLLFLGTLLGWSIAFFVGLRKREPRPLLPRLARWVGALFGLLLIVFLVCFLVILGDTNPVYGVPNIFFETPAIMGVLMLLPKLLAGAGIVMLLFAVLAWVKRDWGWGGRLHYTLLTLAALAMVWVLYYWNFLLG